MWAPDYKNLSKFDGRKGIPVIQSVCTVAWNWQITLAGFTSPETAFPGTDSLEAKSEACESQQSFLCNSAL